MTALDQLQNTLRELNAAALRDLDIRDTSVLQAELGELQRWATSGTGMEAIDDDKIVAAVRAYRTNGAVEGIGHARLLCYGCTRVVDSVLLIEEPPRLKALLEYVDRFRFFPRPFRRCYRGLLHAYFAYDPEAELSAQGRKGWQEVWTYLVRRRNVLETPGSDPDWVIALLEHRNLLTNDPTSRYGMAALRGNYAAVDAVRTRLGIPEDSWIMRRLVVSVLEAALQLTDQAFKAVVVRLLVLFAKHPIMLDYGLARVLDRYAASSTVELSARLREVAVLNWGDPRVADNAAHWSSVTPAAREMVAGWLNAGNPSPP